MWSEAIICAQPGGEPKKVTCLSGKQGGLCHWVAHTHKINKNKGEPGGKPYPSDILAEVWSGIKDWANYQTS